MSLHVHTHLYIYTENCGWVEEETKKKCGQMG